LVFNLLRKDDDEAPARDLCSGVTVWEPEFQSTGDSTDILDKVKNVCKKVDVIVPTDTYLEKIIPTPKASSWRTLTKVFKKDKTPARSAIELRAKELLVSGVGRFGKGCVVVRTKEHGCLVATRLPRSRKFQFEWLPPVFDHTFLAMENPSLPGAGTMFGGALTFSMASRRTAIEAAKQAAIAVSFILRVEKWRDINSRPAYYDPYRLFSAGWE
jgi:hypothetical protein